jgi:hypothetical protein
VFLYLSFDRARFLVELARRNNMTIYYQGDLVTSLPLHGTNAAVQEMLHCQRAADIARKTNRPQGDPFAGSPQGPASGPSGPSFGPGGPSSAPSGPTSTPLGPSSGPGGPSSGPGGPSSGPGGPSSAPAPGGGPVFRPN